MAIGASTTCKHATAQPGKLSSLATRSRGEGKMADARNLTSSPYVCIEALSELSRTITEAMYANGSPTSSCDQALRAGDSLAVTEAM